jgi:hypothetical protein
MDMNWNELIIAAMNSNAVIALISSGALAFIVWIGKKQPKVKQYFDKYGGAIIRGVKLAEANIPDDTENKSLKRLDHALQYVIQVIEAGENRKVTDSEKVQLEAKISEVHDQIETKK